MKVSINDEVGGIWHIFENVEAKRAFSVNEEIDDVKIEDDLYFFDISEFDIIFLFIYRVFLSIQSKKLFIMKYHVKNFRFLNWM